MIALIKQTSTLLLPFLWKDRKRTFSTLFTIFHIGLDAATATAIPWFFSQLVKHCTDEQYYYPMALVLGLMGYWTLQQTTKHIRSIVFFNVINEAIKDIRLKLIMKFHQTPLNEQETYQSAEIISASTRVSMSTRGFMGVSFLTIFPALLKLGVLSFAIWRLHHGFFYFPLGMFTVFIFVGIRIRSFLTSRQKSWETSDAIATLMGDSFHNTKFSRFHLPQEEKRLNQFFQKEAAYWWKNNFHQYMIYIGQAILYILFAGFLLVHIVWLVHQKQLTIPDLILLKGYIFLIYRHISKITLQSRKFFTSIIDLQKVLNILALPNEAKEQQATFEDPPLSSTPILEAREVSFAHVGDKPLLEKLSFAIAPGEKIGIMGTSGLGKSTLCHVLSGLYSPSEGTVYLKGTPIQHLSLLDIGTYLHFISQEAPIITGSIADNLMQEENNDNLEALSYLSTQLEDNTGEAGKKLSGGEKQRILITRSLVHKPQILMLDETLSALDEENAQELLKLIFEQVPTVILVTHRASLLQKFDKVFELSNGQLQLIQEHPANQQ